MIKSLILILAVECQGLQKFTGSSNGTQQSYPAMGARTSGQFRNRKDGPLRKRGILEQDFRLRTYM